MGSQSPTTTADDYQASHEIGQMTVKMVELYLEKDPSDDDVIELYFRLNMSNQSYENYFAYDHRLKTHPFSDNFVFNINSNLKKYGRILSIEIWNQLTLKDTKDIGLGLMDLDPFIKIQPNMHPLEDQEAKRCFINYDNRPGGYADFKIDFHAEPCEELHIQVDKVCLRQLKPRKCFVRLTIGEEVIETKVKEDTPTEILSWKDQPALVFSVPKYITQGLIEVLERCQGGDMLLGELKIDVEFLMAQKGQQIFHEEITIDLIVGGTIRFQTIKTENKQFCEFEQPPSPVPKGHSRSNHKLFKLAPKPVFQTQLLQNYQNQSSESFEPNYPKHQRFRLPSITSKSSIDERRSKLEQSSPAGSEKMVESSKKGDIPNNQENFDNIPHSAFAKKRNVINLEKVSERDDQKEPKNPQETIIVVAETEFKLLAPLNLANSQIFQEQEQ